MGQVVHVAHDRGLQLRLALWELGRGLVKWNDFKD